MKSKKATSRASRRSSPPAEAGPSVAATPDELAPTPTQSAIKAILNVADPEQLSTEALSHLKGIQCRHLPALISAEHLDPQRNSRTCCFDTASYPPAWTAAELCPRCCSLNKLIQASKASENNAFAKSILGTALITTDCLSDVAGAANVAGLPLELIESIIDYVLADMRSSKDGSTLRKLLHTSSWIRYKAAKAFAPIQLYECPSPAPNTYESSSKTHTIHPPRELVFSIWNVLLAYFDDFSIERHERKPAPICESSQIIRTTTGLSAELLGFDIGIHCDQLIAPGGRKLPRESYKCEATSDRLVSNARTVRNACTRFHLGLNTLPAPRFSSIYQRCLNNSLDAPPTGAIIDVALVIWKLGGEANEACEKAWRFDTLQCRRKKPSAP